MSQTVGSGLNNFVSPLALPLNIQMPISCWAATFSHKKPRERLRKKKKSQEKTMKQRKANTTGDRKCSRFSSPWSQALKGPVCIWLPMVFQQIPFFFLLLKLIQVNFYPLQQKLKWGNNQNHPWNQLVDWWQVCFFPYFLFISTSLKAINMTLVC